LIGKTSIEYLHRARCEFYVFLSAEANFYVPN